MKVQKRINQNITVLAEGDEYLDIFKQLAGLEEAFGEDSCGKCKSSDLRFVYRITKDGNDTYEYPELQCKKCKAKLTYGISKQDKGIYPKRYATNDKGKVLKDDNDNAIKRGTFGWTKYNRETGTEE